MKIANVTDWRTDPELADGGAPLDLGDGRTLLVRRTGTHNRTFMAAMVGVDPDNEQALYQVYARTVVCGWRGFIDASGAAVEFSPPECVELFRVCPEMFDVVCVFAAKRTNFQIQALEEDKAQAKKLPGGSKAQARTARN